jgi:CBS domain containing-hemolysin-like protein
MRSRRIGFGVVVDEHGGVEGIFTPKDLVAELVGELQDEYDPNVPSVLPAGPGRWLADGRVSVEDLEDEIHVSLPRGDYSTAAGLVLAVAGRIPDEGDEFRVDGITLTVVRMERRRVGRIRIDVPG